MTTRRQFLRGRFAPRHTPLRPPWALAEAAFLAQCTCCSDCMPVCPTRILVAEGGYPRVDFARGECTFCGACVTACRLGALKKTAGQAPWHLLAKIQESCLAYRDVVCRSCGDACGEVAITFSPRLGGAARPELLAARCTGCGACVSACPAAAVTMTAAGL